MQKVIHFIGIGGVSMQALAKFASRQNFAVTGSDIKPVDLGFATVFFGHNAQNVKASDIVVYSSAIKPDNVELVSAKKLGKKILSRAEFLAEISRRFETVIAVAGTHGKTTTTAMIAEVLVHAGKNPTVHIGGTSQAFGVNFRLGQNKFFVTEACEYDDSFLTLVPDFSVVLNIESEHLDYFKTFKNEVDSFAKFASQSGVVVCQNLAKKILKNNQKNVSSKLLKNSQKSHKIRFLGDFAQAKNIVHKKHKIHYDLFVNGKFKRKVILNSIIDKNVQNSMLCYLVTKALKIDERYFFLAMKKFCGVHRRMEIINKKPLVISDYAHHPSEILTVLQSVRKVYFDKKIVCLFQPHTFSRTQNFFEDFVFALSLADEILMFKTFSARENFVKGATAFDLFKTLKKRIKSHYFASTDALAKYFCCLDDDCVLLILGAGDVAEFASKFFAQEICKRENQNFDNDFD